MSRDMAFLHRKKINGEKIVMLTCYDYPTAVLQDKAGVDVIFVGDSLGTNELGYDREISVTLGDMAHHLKAVRRGVQEAYLLVDMPFRTYEHPDMALATAKELLSHGADGVKLEGMRLQDVGASIRDIRHAKRFANVGEVMLNAFQQYAIEVANSEFPQESNVRKMGEEELRRLLEWAGASFEP